MTSAFTKLSSSMCYYEKMTDKKNVFSPSPLLNRRAALWLLVAGGITLFSEGALARRGRGRGRGRGRRSYRYGDDHEHDRARDAVGAGKVILLSEILLEVRKIIQGDVVGVEFDDKPVVPVYHLTILSKSGSYFDVTVNAVTGAILKVKKK